MHDIAEGHMPIWDRVSHFLGDAKVWHGIPRKREACMNLPTKALIMLFYFSDCCCSPCRGAHQAQCRSTEKFTVWTVQQPSSYTDTVKSATVRRTYCDLAVGVCTSMAYCMFACVRWASVITTKNLQQQWRTTIKQRAKGCHHGTTSIQQTTERII